MIRITSHVLDTARGRPAGGLAVALAMRTEGGWTDVGAAATGPDGRVTNLLPESAARTAGVYRLRFEIGDYYGRLNLPTFYPYADVVFTVEEEGHYHVPLLLSPWGYSTYRGS